MRMKTNANLPCLSALLAAALLMSGCATQRYMGVSLKPGGADPEVQALAARASTGDKQAQLDLGIRFEEGSGVARDLDTAKKLYRQAASDSGGTIWVYTPPVGNGTSGRVVPMDIQPRNTGLRNARSRLVALAESDHKPSTSCDKSKDNTPRKETRIATGEKVLDALDALLKAWRTGDDSEVRNWQTIEVPTSTGLQSLSPLSAVTEILDPDQSISRETIKILSIDLVEPKGGEYRVTVSADLLKSSPCISDPFSHDGASICFKHNINQAVIKSFYYEIKDGCINRLRPGISVS